MYQLSTLSLYMYSLYTKSKHAQNPNISKFSPPLQNILIVTRQHILLNRPSTSLESLMRLTLVIIVLHILHRSKSRLDRHVVPLIARVRDRSANRSSEDVWLAVLKKTYPSITVQLRFLPITPFPSERLVQHSTCIVLTKQHGLHRAIRRTVKKRQDALTLVAVFARTLYCSSTRSRSASLGILKRVIRSIGAIVLRVWRVSRDMDIGVTG
jgi:hypothetical protein